MLAPLLNDLPNHLNHKRLEGWQNAKNDLVAKGFNAHLAERLASLDQILPLLDMCRLAQDKGISVENVAYFYEVIEETLGLTDVQRALQNLGVNNTWEAAARDQLRAGLLRDMAQLTEEVGEVARIIARRYGEQSEKESDKNKDLGEELADVVFVVLCLANQTGVDLQAAFDKKMDLKTKRDHDRHHNNEKLK